MYWIRIDKDMAPLFQADATEIDVARMAHQHQYLARWLCGFYSTHDGKKDFAVTELQQLSGSSYLPLSKFRAKLKDPVKELMQTKTITNEKGEERTIRALFAAGTTITKNDMLHVGKADRSMMIVLAKKVDASQIDVQTAARRQEALPARNVPFPSDDDQSEPFPPLAERSQPEERDTRSAAERGAAARQRSRVAL